MTSQQVKSSRNLEGLFSLEGKTAVVVGGGGHICSELSRGFASAGANVVIVDIRYEKAESIASSIKKEFNIKTLSVQADATDKNDLSNVMKSVTEFSPIIHIAVNGGGINSAVPFLEIEEQDWQKVVDSQLTATYLGCQVFGAHMIKNGLGSIINISSASAETALSKAFAYSASKAGIRNLTQNLGREWGKLGIRVNALRPGFFPTEWNKKNFITPERESSILNHTPMGRFGETHELVGAAIFLASDASSFVTGSEVVVDGGFSAMTV